MSFNSTKILNFALCAALGLAGLWGIARWVLPWIWPFLIAWGAAALLEPGVAYLCRRGLGRPLASGICVLGFLLGTGGLLWLICGRAVAELSELAPRLPGILAGLTDTLRAWRGALERWLERSPEGLRLWADAALTGIADALLRLPAALAGRLPGLLRDAAAAAPAALLFAVTAGIGTYFVSASYPALLHGAARLLPERFLCRARLLRRDLRRTLGRWLKAEGLMSLFVCFVLSGAFLLLGIPYALLLALLTALVDALPVLGAGAVLLPWAVWAFLGGDTPLAVGLAVTYAAVTVLRSCIQAKLLGDQLGLHPLAALAAIYAGWKLWGVWGMLVFPVAAICIKQALPGLEGLFPRL